LELREVDSTGTLKAGEKALADLRKRKLIAQKYIRALPSIILMWLIWTQERTVVHGEQGIAI
jgi:hypothetical protein